MLSETDLKTIAEGAYLYDHAWRFTSLLAGEPFLVGGTLTYFDGCHLYILDFPVPKHAPGVSAELSDLISRLRPKLIWYSGGTAVDPALIGGALQMVHRLEPDPDDICMEIALDVFRLEDHPKSASWVRNGEKKGYVSSVRTAALLGHQHIRLIEEFVARIQPGYLGRAFISCLGSFTRLPDAWIIEIWQGEKLVSFGVIEGWFQNMDVFLYGFADPECPGAFDSLMWAIIRHATSRAKKTLNVGYSINRGVRTFKEKWGARPCGGGYYDQLWHGYAAFDPNCVHWPLRLLQTLR